MNGIKLSIYDIQSLSAIHDIQYYQEARLASQQAQIDSNTQFKEQFHQTASQIEGIDLQPNNPWNKLLISMKDIKISLPQVSKWKQALRKIRKDGFNPNIEFNIAHETSI